MIPLLALMIGAYIVARLFDQITRHADNPSRNSFVPLIVSILALGVTIICVMLILKQGMEAEQSFADMLSRFAP